MKHNIEQILNRIIDVEAGAQTTDIKHHEILKHINKQIKLDLNITIKNT